MRAGFDPRQTSTAVFLEVLTARVPGDGVAPGRP
jgi:hypothetical protein